MKKIVPLLLLISCLHTHGLAQITNYRFSARTGLYTKITGTPVTVNDLHNGVSGLLPIRFNFLYDGRTYSSFGVSTNGKIRLGESLSWEAETNHYSIAEFPDRPVLAPLWDKLALTSRDGISYELSGSSPNRVLTVQWSQVRWSAIEPNPGIEFQVKLYETSNKIEFIYNQLPGPVFGAFAVIGITGVDEGEGNYLSLTNTGTSPQVSSTSPTILGTKPLTNQVYAFSPPGSCSPQADGGQAVSTNSSICAGYQFTLGVDKTFPGTGFSYHWQSSADGVSNWKNISGGSTLTTTQTAATWYRRGITCDEATVYSTPVKVELGAGSPVYANIPYEQNFNQRWLSNCQTRELPSFNWQNNPPWGDRSWRRNDDYFAAGWDDNYESPDAGNGFFARFHVHGAYGAGPHGDLDLYVDCSTPGPKELQFSHFQRWSVTGELSVYYSIDGGANFTFLATIPGLGIWKTHRFDLPSNSPKTIVRFRGTGQQFGGAEDIGLDDVKVVPITCLPPPNLSLLDIQQKTAEAKWTPVAGALGYEYAVTIDYEPNPPATGTFVTDPNALLSGLSTSTDYYLHVRTKCGTNSFSSWTSKFFTTSMDCSKASLINCGNPVTFSMDFGWGVYDLSKTNPGHCGEPALGLEKMFRFVPSVSGPHDLKIKASNAYNTVHYYFKDGSKGCAPVDWTCLGTSRIPTTFSLGNLTAGKEYFILLDLYTVVNSHTETIEISCAVANEECANAGITPASASICSGGKQLLTTSGGASYQWYRNGTLINGATGHTYEATEPGTYDVAITNGACTVRATNTASVTQTSLPAPVITPSGSTVFCEGKNFSLQSSASTGNQWYKDGQVITGANDRDLLITSSGAYTVRTISNSCMSDLSSPVTATVVINPTVTINATGAASFCPGGSVVLNAVPASANSYQWLKDGNAINNAKSNTYTATASGSYAVVVTNDAGCLATSPAIVVESKTSPATPVVTASGPTSFCPDGSIELSTVSAPGISYQWMNNGTVINGATADKFKATKGGSYTIVAKNDAGCTATSLAVAVELKTSPVTPVITASGPTSFCAGGNTDLSTVLVSGISYQWMNNGNVIDGASGNTYKATSSGSYSVVASNVAGCIATSAAIAVEAKTNPAIPVVTASGPTSICPGGSVDLNTASLSVSSYQWMKDGANINGATDKNYKAIAGGSYTVAVTNAAACTATSLPVVVDSKPTPTPAVPVITASGPTTFCEGTVLTLTSSSAGSNQWQKNGIDIVGATSVTYNPVASGNYAVVTTQDGCSATSAMKTIVVNSLPSKPTITASGNVLTSSAAAENQWFLNGAVVVGASGRHLTAQTAGIYSVEVTGNGCAISSDPFNFAGLPPSNNEVKIYPNPVQDELFIANTGQNRVSVKIINMVGAVVHEQSFTDLTAGINVRKLSSGTYLLVITIQQKMSLTRIFIKQ